MNSKIKLWLLKNLYEARKRFHEESEQEKARYKAQRKTIKKQDLYGIEAEEEIANAAQQYRQRLKEIKDDYKVEKEAVWAQYEQYKANPATFQEVKPPKLPPSYEPISQEKEEEIQAAIWQHKILQPVEDEETKPSIEEMQRRWEQDLDLKTGRPLSEEQTAEKHKYDKEEPTAPAPEPAQATPPEPVEPAPAPVQEQRKRGRPRKQPPTPAPVPGKPTYRELQKRAIELFVPAKGNTTVLTAAIEAKEQEILAEHFDIAGVKPESEEQRREIIGRYTRTAREKALAESPAHAKLKAKPTPKEQEQIIEKALEVMQQAEQEADRLGVEIPERPPELPKRKRGRPPKVKSEAPAPPPEPTESPAPPPATEPSKSEAPAPPPEPVEAPAPEPPPELPKRKRGRPPKVKQEEPATPPAPPKPPKQKPAPKPKKNQRSPRRLEGGPVIFPPLPVGEIVEGASSEGLPAAEFIDEPPAPQAEAPAPKPPETKTKVEKPSGPTTKAPARTNPANTVRLYRGVRQPFQRFDPDMQNELDQLEQQFQEYMQAPGSAPSKFAQRERLLYLRRFAKPQYFADNPDEAKEYAGPHGYVASIELPRTKALQYQASGIRDTFSIPGAELEHLAKTHPFQVEPVQHEPVKPRNEVARKEPAPGASPPAPPLPPPSRSPAPPPIGGQPPKPPKKPPAPPAPPPPPPGPPDKNPEFPPWMELPERKKPTPKTPPKPVEDVSETFGRKGIARNIAREEIKRKRAAARAEQQRKAEQQRHEDLNEELRRKAQAHADYHAQAQGKKSIGRRILNQLGFSDEGVDTAKMFIPGKFHRLNATATMINRATGGAIGNLIGKIPGMAGVGATLTGVGGAGGAGAAGVGGIAAGASGILAAAGPIGIGAALIGGALITVTGLLNEMGKRVWEVNKQLADASPLMARVLAIMEIERFRMRLEAGQRLAPGAERLGQAQINLERNTQELRILGQHIGQGISTLWANVKSFFLKPFNDIAGILNFLIEGGAAPDETGMFGNWLVQQQVNNPWVPVVGAWGAPAPPPAPPAGLGQIAGGGIAGGIAFWNQLNGGGGFGGMGIAGAALAGAGN